MSRMATGYELDGSPAPVYDWGWEGPAAQMYSTSDDLSKVCISLVPRLLRGKGEKSLV